MLTKKQEFHLSDLSEWVRVYEIGAAGQPACSPIARLAIARLNRRHPRLVEQRQSADRLLRWLLALSFSNHDGDWLFLRTDRGAPRLLQASDAEPPLRVSLSHSKNWVAVAFTSEMGVGIDIETDRPGRDTAALAAYLRWKPPVGTPEEFYRRWTLWEAYTKCRERGIIGHPGPEFISLCHQPGSPLASGWHAFTMQVTGGVYLAVVLRTKKLLHLELSDLDVASAHPW